MDELEQSQRLVVVPSLLFSDAVLSGAQQRLVAMGYKLALPPDRFEALMDRLASAYTEDTPLKLYLGSILLAGQEFHFAVEARAPFGARAAVSAHFGSDEFIKIHHSSFRTLFSAAPATEIEIPPIPYSEHMVQLLYQRQATMRKRAVALLGRKASELDADDLLSRVRASYRHDAPARDYVGWILIDDLKIAIKTKARTSSEASAAVVAQFGEDHVKSIRNLEDSRTVRPTS